MNKFKFWRYIVILIILIITTAINEFPKYKDYYDGLVHVYFFDVGQGDSILIKTNEGKLILTDGGNNNNVIHRISGVLPFWIKHIDYIVVSHPHADHIYGLISVIENYDVGCVLYQDSYDPISRVEEEFRLALLRKNILVSMDCLAETMYYFSPSSYYENYVDVRSQNPNLASLISIYTYKDFDVLLTGDAETPEQIIALPFLKKDIEIIKVPHHGSSDSFYKDLLIALSPELAIVSVGKNNPYKLPSVSAINGYEDLGIKLLRTDIHGGIEVVSNGYLWSIVER